MPTPDGKVAHAELAIGDSLIMLSDPFDQGDEKSIAPEASSTARYGVIEWYPSGIAFTGM